MTTYAVGDVHGCYRELERLLELLRFNASVDRMLFVGDLVNRGSQSLEVLQLVRSLGGAAVSVLGNHDLHFLAVACGVRRVSAEDTLDELLAAEQCQSLVEWMCSWPLLWHEYISTESGKMHFVLVHAGLPPHLDMQTIECNRQQVERSLQASLYDASRAIFSTGDGLQPEAEQLQCTVDYLTRMRFCNARGEYDFTVKNAVSKPPPGMRPWFEFPIVGSAPQRYILFGHWAAMQGETGTPEVIALDAGCVWGGSLRALRLEDGELFEIPAMGR